MIGLRTFLADSIRGDDKLSQRREVLLGSIVLHAAGNLHSAHLD